MTEENMKKRYDGFIESGQLERAKKITDIPRYSKFAEVIKEPEPKPKSKKEK